MTPADVAFMVKLREHKRKPAAVFLLDYDPGPLTRDWSVEKQMRSGALPAFHVKQLEPGATDLRFLVGIPVHLHADDPSRASQWVDWLLRFGAGPIVQLTQGEIYTWQQS